MSFSYTIKELRLRKVLVSNGKHCLIIIGESLIENLTISFMIFQDMNTIIRNSS